MVLRTWTLSPWVAQTTTCACSRVVHGIVRAGSKRRGYRGRASSALQVELTVSGGRGGEDGFAPSPAVPYSCLIVTASYHERAKLVSTWTHFAAAEQCRVPRHAGSCEIARRSPDNRAHAALSRAVVGLPVIDRNAGAWDTFEDPGAGCMNLPAFEREGRTPATSPSTDAVPAAGEGSTSRCQSSASLVKSVGGDGVYFVESY